MKDTVTLKRGIFKILYRVFLALSFNIEGQFFFFGQVKPKTMFILSYNIFFLFYYMDTMVDVEKEYQKEYIKNFMNITFDLVIQRFGLVFEQKSIENVFTYLRDMLDSLVDVEKEYQEQQIKKFMNLTFGHVIQHFSLVFEQKLIYNLPQCAPHQDLWKNKLRTRILVFGAQFRPILGLFWPYGRPCGQMTDI